MKNTCFVRLVFDTDVDESFNDFVNKINDFVRLYDGRKEELLSSSITAFKGEPIDDPWKNRKL